MTSERLKAFDELIRRLLKPTGVKVQAFSTAGVRPKPAGFVVRFRAGAKLPIQIVRTASGTSEDTEHDIDPQHPDVADLVWLGRTVGDFERFVIAVLAGHDNPGIERIRPFRGHNGKLRKAGVWVDCTNGAAYFLAFYRAPDEVVA